MITKLLTKFIFHPKILLLRYSVFIRTMRYLIDFTHYEKLLYCLFKYVKRNRIEGDYLEFGVDKGKTIIMAYNFCKIRKHNDIKFFAFDSFKGLPEPKGIDKEFNWKKGDYKSSVQEFKKHLKKGKVDMSRVKIVEGWYKDTLNEETKKKYNLKKASIVYIDVDLYESCVPVLNFITNILSEGSIIIFDDWYCFKGRADRGEQRAFNEWLKRNPNIKAVEYHKLYGEIIAFQVFNVEG